jgi:hypothetical protein
VKATFFMVGQMARA